MTPSTNEMPLLLTLEELVNACQWDKNWVLALLEEDIIQSEPQPQCGQAIAQPGAVYFNSVQLTQVRLASRLRRDFDASPQAIALILDLLNELRPLRQLQRQLRTLQQVQDVDMGMDDH